MNRRTHIALAFAGLVLGAPAAVLLQVAGSQPFEPWIREVAGSASPLRASRWTCGYGLFYESAPPFPGPKWLHLRIADGRDR